MAVEVLVEAQHDLRLQKWFPVLAWGYATDQLNRC
jgi:hypothetical protein